MTRFRRTVGLMGGAALVVGVVASTAPAQAAPGAAAPAPVQDFLADQLGTLGDSVSTTVLVHGTDIGAARAAVSAVGMTPVTEFDQIGVAVATGTADQVGAVRGEPGVVYLEGNSPISFADQTSNLYLPICATGLMPQNGPGPLDVGTFNTISGTSMAAPHIAGIVAQLFQPDPTATPAEVVAAVVGYQTVGDRTMSHDKGAGLVDVVAAVAALRG